MNSGCRASDEVVKQIEEGGDRQVEGRKLINLPRCMERTCNSNYVSCICCIVVLPIRCWAGPDAMKVCNLECHPELNTLN